ncbi:MAG: nucleotidyltransferase domain-containing protein, partial [Methanosarcinaceae archaeon]
MKKLPIAIQTFSKIRKEGYDKVDGCYTRDNQMPSACDEKYLNMLKEIILSIVDTKKVMVFLFGSRVSGRHSSSADADIGLLADEKLPANLYHKIR